VEQGKEIRRWLGEEEDALTSGTTVSATHSEGNAAARSRGLLGHRLGSAQSAKRGTARVREQTGRGEELGYHAESEEEK
jgi:hypothetical protein